MKIVRNPVNRNDRVGMLHKCWGNIFTNLIEGGYYEFGVYHGVTFLDSWRAYLDYKKWAASQLNSPEQWRRDVMKDYETYQHEFYGFDTFEGMPGNQEGNVTFAKGTFLSSQIDIEEKCKKLGMRFRIFKGLFSVLPEETVKDLQPAAIVNIDGDLYFSARDALGKVAPKLQQGTILLMDDYYCFASDNNKGERRALKEFTAVHTCFEFEPWFSYFYSGQAFICHKK